MQNGTETLPLEFFHFRVLSKWEGKTCVARCLETGSVVTADNATIARSMILEVLQDEVSHAIEHHNLKNLFSAPASLDTWQEFYRAEKMYRSQQFHGVEMVHILRGK